MTHDPSFSNQENPYRPGVLQGSAPITEGRGGPVLGWMVHAGLVGMVLQQVAFRGLLPDFLELQFLHVLLVAGLAISLLYLAFWLRTRRILYLVGTIAHCAGLIIPRLFPVFIPDQIVFVATMLNYIANLIIGMAFLSERLRGHNGRQWGLRAFGIFSILSIPLASYTYTMNTDFIAERFEDFCTLMTLVAVFVFFRFPLDALAGSERG